jgi:fumarate reductase subunit C
MNTAPKSMGRRPFIRPMGRWWMRDPFLMRYMLRELTAIFVALYALVLLAGLVLLARGPDAYGQWLAVLRSPLSIGLHVLLLVALVYHTWSWFQIMPKTMPPVRIGAKVVNANAITAAGVLAAALACTVVLVLLRVMGGWIR